MMQVIAVSHRVILPKTYTIFDDEYGTISS